MLLVPLLVFFRRTIGATPVDVVIARDWEPWTQKAIHGLSVLSHLIQPRLSGVVALNQIANGHHQVRTRQIGISHSTREHTLGLIMAASLITGVRQESGIATGAIAVHRKSERFTLGGQGEDPTIPVGVESTGVKDDLVILGEQGIPEGSHQQHGSNEHALQYAEVFESMGFRRKGCVIRHWWTIFRLKSEESPAQSRPRFIVEA